MHRIVRHLQSLPDGCAQLPSLGVLRPRWALHAAWNRLNHSIGSTATTLHLQHGARQRLPSASSTSPLGLLQQVCVPPCRGLQLLGMSGLGMGGGFERLHYLLESAFDPDGQLSITFLRVSCCSAQTATAHQAS
jgi:hypothetical protein